MNDPGVEEEWDEVDMPNYEGSLPRKQEKWDQEMAPISEEITRFDSLKSWADLRNVPEDQQESDQPVTEKDKMSVIQNVTKQDSEEDSAHDKMPNKFIANYDPNWPQNSKSKPEHALKSSQIDKEQKEQLDMKSKQGENIQSDSSSRKSKPPQGGGETPEKEEKIHTRPSENETSKKVIADWKKDYLCYVWNTFSIISMIFFLRNYMRKNSPVSQDKTNASPMSCIAGEVSLPDSDTLHKWRGEEILEGFAHDLLEAMKTICNKNGGLVIENFWMDAYDINVPITPPEPYSFRCLLWNNHVSDLLPDMQVCGQVKVVENETNQDGCPCQSSDAEDDMVCLLHCDNEKTQTKTCNIFDSFCLKNTHYLSKSRVTRWFQSTTKQAWALISHKYEFELSIRYIDAPGALIIRFRSGKVVHFRMNPVVKVNADVHYYITPCSSSNLDHFWAISLAAYEDQLLQCLTKRLPENSCHGQTLEIAYFLHRRQTALTGSSAVKEFHFKTALMHLLLTKDASQWKPNYLTNRLQDLMDFMEKPGEKAAAPRSFKLPAEFIQAKPVNLFHPLVAHNCIYSNATIHFQELLRNAHMLIQDYTDQFLKIKSSA
ncbi:hypothetical protein Q5P01_026218 [Channa striata]|uniref:Inositol 1,4,5-trisphosphate receptor-interacting protein n=1 Tax=Channa striata TaxID=64152 RepID=A0AA88IKX7_CHASR|nr:hypothetical protein Q5P01_026218 [Channa striata]